MFGKAVRSNGLIFEKDMKVLHIFYIGYSVNTEALNKYITYIFFIKHVGEKYKIVYLSEI